MARMSANVPAPRLRRAEMGQAILWVAVMLPLFLSAVGLAIDGGVVFAARRELQNAADGAARAGVTQLDEWAYRESAGARVVLDQRRARQAAVDYLAATRPGIDAVIQPGAQRVVVEVSREVPTAFMRLAGIETVRISATAPAELRVGVERGTP
ncbi:MAG TPA: pilus assembly protein TadG-related protein [Chloroflexota bacterium]|nr:pilus assembly protein TadG-related protein [Chloroflexota bacterium]